MLTLKRENLGCMIVVSKSGDYQVATPRAVFEYLVRTSNGIPKNAIGLHGRPELAWERAFEGMRRFAAAVRAGRTSPRVPMHRISKAQARREYEAYKRERGSAKGFYAWFYKAHPKFPRQYHADKPHAPLKELLRRPRVRTPKMAK